MQTINDPYETIIDLDYFNVQKQAESCTSANPIARIACDYGDALTNGDVEHFSKLLTEDYVALRPGRSPITGIASACEQVLRKGFPSANQMIRFNHEEIIVEGDVATAWGTSTVRTIVNGRDAATEGRYLWVLRKVKGTWKLARDSRN